jgi:hypothetical protein
MENYASFSGSEDLAGLAQIQLKRKEPKSLSRLPAQFLAGIWERNLNEATQWILAGLI